MPDQIKNNEIHLLVRLKNSEEVAFAELYKQHSAGLYHNILRLVKRHDIAQELLQELFLKIWEKRESIVITQDFKAYLFRIAVNKVNDFFRTLKKDRAIYESIKAATVSEWHPEEDLGRGGAMEAVVHLALDTLPRQRKKIFCLCKMEGKSYQEVSRLMGVSTSTINDHIVKATRTIKEFVLSHPEGYSLCIMALLLR